MTLSAGQPGSERAARFAHQARRGFTLIELILVMALLTVVISLTAPKLSRFFHGRTLDSEARRLLALTRSGQSRAVSEGVPMDLWVDAEQGTFGLEAEPSYETSDPKRVDFTLDDGLQLEVVNKTTVVAPVNTMSRSRQASVASVPRVKLVHAGLPTIRFLPDGSIGESSPQMLHLTSNDSGSLWLAQSRDGLNYEIRSTDKQGGP
jgi:prepilin-type N-terminal cleavage/methylation domain-containing protein